MSIGRKIGGVLVATALVAAACTGDDGGDEGGEQLDLDGAAEAAFTVRGSTGQVGVTDAEPGTTLQLVDDGDRVVEAFFAPDGHQDAEGVVDEDGNLGFGRVPPGEGYRVTGQDGDATVVSEPVDVGALDDVPDAALFEGQTLEEGFQYIETRDGTLLSAMVRFPENPLPGTPEGGPYPTLIEMSGYDPSNPNSPQPATQFTSLYGFATVGINIRGTGCSGGALTFYEDPQVADGYDVIETVAAQDWVMDNEVGMVGLSYPGITQLYMAQTNPPSLAAISPMSIIEDTYRGTLYPGGILNSGFATAWSEQVGDNARAPEDGGYEWVGEQIAAGDEVCEENQLLRSQNLDLVQAAATEPYLDPARYDTVTPYEFADQIDIPVFLTGQWHDEQTGGHFPAFIEQFADNPRARFTMSNGPHADGLSLQVSQRWFEFLDFYIAKRIPEVPDLVRAFAPSVLAGTFGAETPVPEDRFTDFDTYEEALAAYEAEPPIRVLFEDGAGSDDPGAPVAAYEAEFEQWPPADAEATTWFFGADESLTPDEPNAADDDPDGAVTYDHDPDQGAEVTLPGYGQSEAFTALPDYTWEPLDEGRAVVFETDPLDETTTIVGPSRADVWLQSSAEDTDLEVTVTEVRPDGEEVYVQSGWLRASHRTLDEDRSTDVLPIATHLEEDAEPLPEGEFVEVSVEVFPVAHTFREGSQIRVAIDTPGATRPEWEFDTVDAQGEFNTVAISADHPSRITFPVVEVDGVPDEYPPCPGLRGQPCRPYEAITNTSAAAPESDELQGFVGDVTDDAEALDEAGEDGGAPDAATGEGFDHSTAALRVLGDDPELDELAVDCHQDDLASCDDLFVQSPDGSLYEAYGATCGARLDEPTNRICVDVLVGVGDDPAGLGNDAFLNELANQCAQGDMLDCDILYAEAEIGSEYERFGGSCGGRVRTEDDCTELL